jgi:hypothetical protein
MSPLILMLQKGCHSGESRNPVFSEDSGCRIMSGMTEKSVYKQTLTRRLLLGELNIRKKDFVCQGKNNNPWVMPHSNRAGYESGI